MILKKGQHFTGFFASAGPDTAVIASRTQPMFPQLDLSTRNWATASIDAQRMQPEHLLRMGRLGILLWGLGRISHPINRGPEAGETSGLFSAINSWIWCGMNSSKLAEILGGQGNGRQY